MSSKNKKTSTPYRKPVHEQVSRDSNKVRLLGFMKYMAMQQSIQSTLRGDPNNKSTRSSRKKMFVQKAITYGHSKTSILAFTLTKNEKGKATADIIAIGPHSIKKLGSTEGQQFAQFWKLMENCSEDQDREQEMLVVECYGNSLNERDPLSGSESDEETIRPLLSNTFQPNNECNIENELQTGDSLDGSSNDETEQIYENNMITPLIDQPVLSERNERTRKKSFSKRKRPEQLRLKDTTERNESPICGASSFKTPITLTDSLEVPGLGTTDKNLLANEGNVTEKSVCLTSDLKAGSSRLPSPEDSDSFQKNTKSLTKPFRRVVRPPSDSDSDSSGFLVSEKRVR